MTETTKVCYFVGCGIKMTAPTPEMAEGMFLTHIQLVHLNDLLTERTARINSIQAKNAEDNMTRYQQLAAAGLEKREILSLIGNPGAVKMEKDSDEKIELPEWAKDQSYESWKIEFDYYKNATLGVYKDAELISETNKNSATDLDVHKSETKLKILQDFCIQVKSTLLNKPLFQKINKYKLDSGEYSNKK